MVHGPPFMGDTNCIDRVTVGLLGHEYDTRLVGIVKEGVDPETMRNCITSGRLGDWLKVLRRKRVDPVEKLLKSTKISYRSPGAI